MLSLRWSNIWLIFRREVRDQLRDKRTLFMIFVLPILLYPLLGMGMLKFAEAFEQKARKVMVVGAESLPDEPPLLSAGKNSFETTLFDSTAEAGLLVVETASRDSLWANPKGREIALRGHEADVVVILPLEIKSTYETERVRPEVFYDSANEKSQNTYLRVREVLSRWNEKIVAGRLKRDDKPAAYTEPIQPKAEDVATPEQVGGTIWAKIFPFILVMMSLTGAFYPAVDICAGEKERGTMETLLISPAARGEIVLGKFFTVVLASIMTALLNILSMGLTFWQLASHFGMVNAIKGGARAAGGFAAPSMMATFWMVVILIPLACFFSAICLAIAVLAKSMKEGQYYMTPLYIFAMPLIFLTLMPGVEINLFYSLVPITGVSLLLRALIQGDYLTAWAYFIPVLLPTSLYGLVALRWAVDQFRREDVLFRESERFDLYLWLRHLIRDRGPLPSGGQSILCFVVMLTSAWFITQAIGSDVNAINTMALGQVAFILLPPVLMALVLTSSPRRTLRLTIPSKRYMLIAIVLGFTLNPIVREIGTVVDWLFPTSDTVKKLVGEMMSKLDSVWLNVFFFAVIPAICEEFAFRGFILSGLETIYSRRSAVIISSLLFGFLHVLLSLFQQLFNATWLGIILALLAIRSRSLLPGIVFHLITNGLAVLVGELTSSPLAPYLFRNGTEGLYNAPILAICVAVSTVLIYQLYRHGTENLSESESSQAATPPLLEPAR